MKTRLHKIKIQNFKAFRDFTLDLEGRHLLVYGANGSGKSSLYWALYTFLQSARKPNGAIAKYFDSTNGQNLLNIFEQAEENPRLGEIALTLRDKATKNDTTYHISEADHGTHNQPMILKGDLASDFITYRFFFGFSHFRNSEKFNLWPLFEKEILPFCVSTGGQNPLSCWNAIKSGNPNPFDDRGPAGTNAYDDFRGKTNTFAGLLPGIVDSISDEAQKFYDQYFVAGDSAKVSLKLRVTTRPSFIGTNQTDSRFVIPVIEFGIQLDGKQVERPQSFLNEAKLTQLALSIRFAASLVNLHESDLKLLVLDDLLVSLDMSNRMKVVEILLSDTFAGYQKIILTHDLGLFREFSRRLMADHADWCSIRLRGNPKDKIVCINEKNEIQQAQEHIEGYNLDQAAHCLRKAAENLGKRYREWLEGKSLPPGEFFTLTEHLRAARNKLLEEPLRRFNQIAKSTPDAYRDLLVHANDDDIDNNTDLDVRNKGILKCQRNRLRQLLTDEQADLLRRIDVLDQILACTSRVLNPAAHGGDPPIYEKEVEDALELVKQLETIVTT